MGGCYGPRISGLKTLKRPCDSSEGAPSWIDSNPPPALLSGRRVCFRYSYMHWEVAEISDKAACFGRLKGGQITQKEILEALRRLTAMEWLTVLETALQQIREDLQQMGKPLTQIEKKRQLAAVAEALLPDYTADGELAIFTTLDSEDINEER